MAGLSAQSLTAPEKAEDYVTIADWKAQLESVPKVGPAFDYALLLKTLTDNGKKVNARTIYAICNHYELHGAPAVGQSVQNFLFLGAKITIDWLIIGGKTGKGVEVAAHPLLKLPTIQDPNPNNEGQTDKDDPQIILYKDVWFKDGEFLSENIPYNIFKTDPFDVPRDASVQVFELPRTEARLAPVVGKVEATFEAMQECTAVVRQWAKLMGIATKIMIEAGKGFMGQVNFKGRKSWVQLGPKMPIHKVIRVKADSIEKNGCRNLGNSHADTCCALAKING